MSGHSITRACVGITVAAILAGTARAEPPRLVASVEGFTEYRLANGLRVLLGPDGSRPRVTVNLTVFAGSRHEGLRRDRHGPPDRAPALSGDDVSARLSSDSGKSAAAQWNASTWLDCTNYYETLPATDDNVAFAIRVGSRPVCQRLDA